MLVRGRGTARDLPLIARSPLGQGISGWNFSFKEVIIESKEAAYESF